MESTSKDRGEGTGDRGREVVPPSIPHPPSSDVVILGGGFAGLACATALASAGLRVTVLEKKPHLGGRAYSFKDPESGCHVDNGQHLFLGCYRQTRKFLKTIGATQNLKFLTQIRLDFAEVNGRQSALRCPSYLGAPWHLAAGVLRLSGLSLADKWGMLRLDRYIRKIRGNAVLPPELDRVSVTQWLSGLGQSQRIQERLFNPIALGALNDDPGVASALGLAQVLREAFFRDVESSRLGVSAVPLSELYTKAAQSFIESRDGCVLVAKKIAGLIEDKGRVIGARTEGGETFKAGCVVSTLPPWDLKRLELPPMLHGAWAKLGASPIIGISLWLDRPILEHKPLVGLIGAEMQWAFNKSLIWGESGSGEHLSLVISGAHKQLAWEPKELLAAAQRDLSRCFSAFQKAKILRWKAVKEPFATLSPIPGSDALRPEPGEGMPGFYFAGDWTRTGLPATIESAVASGHQVAQKIFAQEKRNAQVR